jgi:hypothetical protein
MTPYENPEPFYGTARKEHPIAAELKATKDVALRLGPAGQRHTVKAKPEAGLSDNNLDFIYLDREILATRTTKLSRQPGFEPPDHAMRLDVLLASNDGVPIVGEIKVKRDRDLAYALIQALACVSVLATGHQRTRLQTHYGEHLTSVPASGPPRFDVYLISVARTGRATYLGELDRTARYLASELLAQPTIAAVVRRIAMIDARLTNGEFTLSAQ